MIGTDITYFTELKTSVALVFSERHPGASENMAAWTGQDILNFQEDLMARVGGRFSEKWFYTHLKADQTKLPRIDMLNLLSQYAGYRDWGHYKSRGSGLDEVRNAKVKRTMRSAVVFLGIIFLGGLLTVFLWPDTAKCRFCFLDADSKQPIANSDIEILLAKEKESPFLLKADSFGCFEYRTKQQFISFIVRTPYYKPDTIIRTVYRIMPEEKVLLRTDDYALMLHYFSNSKVGDWRKRSMQLNEMFANDARIFQVHMDNGAGVEMYNKQEFIRKMMMPLRSLKQIKILDIAYNSNKISSLRFIQLPGGNK